MLTVVNTEFNPRAGTVTIEGDGQEEVLSAAARNMAIQAATSRLSRPGISGNPSAYPVDANGETSDGLMNGTVPVAKYRCDYPVSASTI